MKKITVFTPTFNRAHLLPRLYESLKKQTSKDFVWMVIDDGSSDGTAAQVLNWQKQNLLEIKYFYKQNGGMHTAHNLAYAEIDTELNVCIDSDDAMPPESIKNINDCWSALNHSSLQFSGIVGLDEERGGNIIGTPFPHDVSFGSYSDIYFKQKVKGDKKFVLRTDLVKNFPPYPEFIGEKLVPLGILYMMMGDDKPFIYLNKTLCTVEYQPEGSTNSIIKQYFQSPRGFLYARKIRLQYKSSIFDKLKTIIHIATSAYILKDFKEPLKNNKYSFFTFLFYPIGGLNYLFLKMIR